LTVFGYRSGTSFIYVLDVRVKLASLVLISLISLRMGPLGLLILTIALLLLMRSARVSCLSAFWELRFFLIFLAFIIFTRGVSVPELSTAGWKAVSLSVEGFYEGAMICWRLLIVVFFGLLLSSTTRVNHIKAAVEWLLHPVPMIPGKRVAVMIALLMRFVPVILNQVEETAQAQRARGVENRKNPVYRMTKLAVPLFRRTLQDADKLTLAMEARCYSETRTDPLLKATRKDWMAMLAVGLLSLLLMVPQPG
jgi:energy-coupling factor transporter transmembrane protein EcfT